MLENRKTFPATLEALPQMLKWVRDALEQTLIDEKEKLQLEIAAEEAVVNVITHGHNDSDLSLTLAYSYLPEKTFELNILDNSAPFNPLLHPCVVDPDTPIEERELGGLGVPLIRRAADTLLYRREGENNILTLIKNLEVS